MGGKGLQPLNSPLLHYLSIVVTFFVLPSIHHPSLIPSARSKKKKKRGIREHGNGHGRPTSAHQYHKLGTPNLHSFQFAYEFREKLVSIRFGVRPDERDAHVCKINSHIDEARLLAKREEGRGSDDGSMVAAESGMDLLSIREMLPDASGVRIARLGLRRG